MSGTTEQEHLKYLKEVFKRLEKYGLRVKKSKCTFFQDSVEYLGYVIDKEGVRPVKEKIKAMVTAKSPVNIEQLQSSLGMVNYYGKFIPNLSTIAATLNQLRRKGFPWFQSASFFNMAVFSTTITLCVFELAFVWSMPSFHATVTPCLLFYMYIAFCHGLSYSSSMQTVYS